MTTRRKKTPTRRIRLDLGLDFSESNNAQLIAMKHKQIAEGASKVFFKKGFHSTTIRDIGRACNMSMGQLYHYISSKDDVLYLIYSHMQKVWQEHVSRTGVSEIKDPVEKLTHAFSLTVEFCMQQKDLVRFLFRETRNLDKEHLSLVLMMDDKNMIGFWRELLEEVKKEKAVDIDPPLAANLIYYLMLFLPFRGWNFKDKMKEERLAFLKDFFLKGLGIHPSQMKALV